MKRATGLRALTLFNAYVRACHHMASALASRGSRVGISVDKDYFARRYQRWERPARVFEYKLSLVLGDNSFRADDLCYKCACYKMVCQCDCRVRPWDLRREDANDV